MPTHVLPTTYTIRCTFIHISSRIVILLKLLDERLSCTEMYISDEALVEHSVLYLVQKCTLQIFILLKLLDERLSCTEMYIADEVLVEHSVSYLVHKCT